MSDQIVFNPIGFVRTRFDSRKGVPSQGQVAQESLGTIEMKEEFVKGIEGISPGDQITVVFNFHQSEGYDLSIVPCQGTEATGVFNTRSPDRPNGVGITVVTVSHVEGRRIDFAGADMIDGTPIIDMKPYLRKPMAIGLK